MDIINSIDDISVPFCVVFGNFDGFHLGHQYLLELTRNMALEKRAKVCVVTFSPHPHIFFKQRERFLLANERLKEIFGSHFEIDFFYSIPFDQKMATLDAKSFIQKFVKRKNLRGIVIGHDFALGHKRQGDASFFEQYCSQHKLSFLQAKTLCWNREVCSSSLIRESLARDNLQKAKELLGRPFQMLGEVRRGKGLGKTIGVPTINIYPDKELLVPNFGVYITEVHLDGVIFPAITNVGINPTTDRDINIKVESHLLTPIHYEVKEGEELIISFYKKIRKEMKFDSVEELKGQIEQDIKVANNELL